MPIAPMLAKLAGKFPTDDLSYGYDFKWDGFRGMASVRIRHSNSAARIWEVSML
jgi:ATP-dependent DNA ligase